MAHLIQFYAPLIGWRRIDIADNHAGRAMGKRGCALVEKDSSDAKKITLVMYNLNTHTYIHTGASLYKAFEPEIVRRLMEKLEFIYTPKHGSWLNMAECEFSVLSRQCLNRRLVDKESVRREVDVSTTIRNRSAATVEWRFTTEDARLKLKQFYPAISN